MRNRVLLGLARARAAPGVVAIDATRAQLESARRCQQEHGLAFPLIEADGACVPLRAASFDLVVSEYGASVWCDPERWIAEAARLLRPGGRLVFLTNSVLATLCVPEEEGPAQEQLLRPQRGLNRVRWPGGGVEFHPGHGEWIRILRGERFRDRSAPRAARTARRDHARVLRHRVGRLGAEVAGRGSLERAPLRLHTARLTRRNAGSCEIRAIACARDVTPIFWKIDFRWLFTVCSLIQSASAIS